MTFQPGAVGAERTEVLSGLIEGQRVVLPAGSSLTSGPACLHSDSLYEDSQTRGRMKS